MDETQLNDRIMMSCVLYGVIPAIFGRSQRHLRKGNHQINDRPLGKLLHHCSQGADNQAIVCKSDHHRDPVAPCRGLTKPSPLYH